MTAGAGSDHLPDRATYDCHACGKPWPCDPAREHLMTHMPDRIDRAIRLWDELENAIYTLPPEPLDVLLDRFLRWAR